LNDISDKSMKLNFSLHFVQFLSGLIVLFSLFPLFNILDRGLFDGELLYEYLEEDEPGIFVVLFCLFLAYGLGGIVEIFTLRNYRFLKLADRIESLVRIFSLENDFILSKSVSFVRDGKVDDIGLSAWETYKLMRSFVVLKSDNLSKMIQNHANISCVLRSVQIACGVTCFNVMLGVFGLWETDCGLVAFLLFLLLLVFIFLFISRLYRQALLDFFASIEGAYSILCKYGESSQSRMEEKVQMEVNM